jgi:putative DNA methylase
MNRPASLLAKIDWKTLDDRVSYQQRNREVHSPAISLYRWWARRPHALIGGILDAAPAGAQISDPFSGGGTVAVEAAQRDLGVYAQDLHPWAAAGLATALDRVDPSQLQAGVDSWLEELAPERSRLYGIGAEGEVGEEVLTTFWVRIVRCPRCQSQTYLYPYPLLSLASRRKEETHAFYGCNGCGTITRSKRDLPERRCSGCRRQLGGDSVSQIPEGKICCRRRGCEHEFAAFGPTYEWRPVLVQRRRDGAVEIARPTAAEREAAQIEPPQLPASLRGEIPIGLETARLRRAGFRRWADLYPPRQLHSILTAAAVLDRLNVEPAVRTRLQLALCGAGEMAGYASRWDRFYPKAFEAMANHRFSLTGFAAEVNLLSDRGRGTLPRRLQHSLRASRWGEDLPSLAPRVRPSRGTRLVTKELDRPAVVCGSSATQLLPNNSVDLVLTDPPYYDDVQYAELGALFLAWAQATGLIGDSVHVDFRSEAVHNSKRGTDAGRYCELLTAVLSETARTLKPKGRVVLTFHNTDGRAWWALARALGRSGFYVNALAVAHAENEADHAKRGRRAFSRDLVIECRSFPSDGLVIASQASDPESRQLIAAGRAVADLARELASGQIKRTRSYEVFGRSYRSHLGAYPSTYIRLGLPREEH